MRMLRWNIGLPQKDKVQNEVVQGKIRLKEVSVKAREKGEGRKGM